MTDQTKTALLSKLRAPVAGERAAFIAWLTGSYPNAYSEPEAVRLWHHGHVSALAWQERSRRAALACAPVVDTQDVPHDTGNPEADRLIGRLMSSDPDFDDCADAARLIRALASAPVAGEAELNTERNLGFNAGICVALQVVTSMDCGVTWREIVTVAGKKEMLDYAANVAPEEWELAGFKTYAMSEMNERKPRKRAAAAAPQASEPECSCPSGDGSLRHPCAAHPAQGADGGAVNG